jgi:hypothetical protein
VSQLANELDRLYLDIFQIDVGGLLPDDVVDSLEQLKDLSMFAYCRHLSIAGPIRFGYWPEEELDSAIHLLGILESYFAPNLGYDFTQPGDILRDAISSALNRKGWQAPST